MGDDTRFQDPGRGLPRLSLTPGARRAALGGSTVAVEQATEAVGDVPFFFLFGDYQGSAQLMMSNEADPSTATIQRNAYTPYGAVREFDPDGSAGTASAMPLTIERGWLSQVADEATTSLGTGLTYLNARYYDPVASRFISPDPLLDVMDPKTLDPYRYAENNPVFYTDATGLNADCSSLSGLAATYCGGYAEAQYADAKKNLGGGKGGSAVSPGVSSSARATVIKTWQNALENGSQQEVDPARLLGCFATSNCGQWSVFDDYTDDGRVVQNIFLGIGSNYSRFMPQDQIAADLRTDIELEYGVGLAVGDQGKSVHSEESRGQAGKIQDGVGWVLSGMLSMRDGNTSNWEDAPLPDSVLGSTVSDWTVVSVDPNSSLATVRVTTTNPMTRESLFREASRAGYEAGAQDEAFKLFWHSFVGEEPQYDVMVTITWEFQWQTNP